MSGQAVAIPLVPIAVAGGAVVIAAGVALVGVSVGAYGAAKIVKKIVDGRIEAALRKIELEKAKIGEWEHFQVIQRKEMAVLEKAQLTLAALESQLGTTKLSDARAKSAGDGPTAKGYVSEARNKAEKQVIEEFLESIAAILGGLSDKLIQLDGSPFKKLLNQEKKIHKRLASGEKLTVEEIRSFREVIIRTCKSYTAFIETKVNKRQELFDRAGSLLNDILLYSHLTGKPEETGELQSMRSYLLSLMNSGAIPSGQVEFLEKRFVAIRTAIDQRLANTALREALADSVERNLADMGYETIEGFSENKPGSLFTARMKIPGGEQVRIAVQQNNSISFEVCHETAQGEASINEEAIPQFRECEKQWCLDLQELIRRLTVEGFSYSVNFERLTPESSIPIVVVESAEDILADEDDDEAERYQIETHQGVKYHDSE